MRANFQIQDGILKFIHYDRYSELGDEFFSFINEIEKGFQYE